jgi:hypothetical protein
VSRRRGGAFVEFEIVVVVVTVDRSITISRSVLSKRYLGIRSVLSITG